MIESRLNWQLFIRLFLGTAFLYPWFGNSVWAQAADNADATQASLFASRVRPLLARYCLGCHDQVKKKGELDLARFKSLALVRKDLKPWQMLVEQLDAGEMPPKSKPQPTAEDRSFLIKWARGILDAEARARAGDPGFVPLHRLSNAEYDRVICDLTGINLRPTRQFPTDGAAGEGFTNAAVALPMSPAMMSKYMTASKDIASHAVLLPDGFRFSPTKTQRDWTDESLTRLRGFYKQFTKANDGALPLQPYMAALVRYRDDLLVKTITLDTVAANEKLNAKYLAIIWHALTNRDQANIFPLQRIRSAFKTAKPQDVDRLVGDVNTWHASLWNFVKIGSYSRPSRQEPKAPNVVQRQTLRLKYPPWPGQSDVTLFLAARDLIDKNGDVLWERPRFEANGKPTLLLRDYATFGPRYEVDYASLFAGTTRYLSAAVDSANGKNVSPKDIAAKHHVNEDWLKRWINVLAVTPYRSDTKGKPLVGRVVAPATMTLLNTKTPTNAQRPAINGWIPKGTDLPVVVTNASGKVENVPGRMLPHSVAAHPTPTQFVAVIWQSPIEAKVRIEATIAHAHPSCGNGVEWWVETKLGERVAIIAEGQLDLGKQGAMQSTTVNVSRGDRVILGLNARNNNHFCDLTRIAMTVTQVDQPKRVWDLAADVADNVQAGNPHADRLGNKDVWHFVMGLSKERQLKPGSGVATNSLLTQWRAAASDPKRRSDAGTLAGQLQQLLTLPRPDDSKKSEQAVYDQLVSTDGPLLKDVDINALARSDNVKQKSLVRYGLPVEQFKNAVNDSKGNTDLIRSSDAAIEFKLPANLLRDYEFVVDASLPSGSLSRAVQFQVTTTKPSPTQQWDAKTPIVASPDETSRERLMAGFDQFREVFPRYICYPHIIPLDEIVCLKVVHREDEPLKRLFLNEQQSKHLNRLWKEHRFISRFPLTENEYLPLFIGFVTQDQPKSTLNYFENQRDPYRKRAEQFERDFEAAAKAQLAQLQKFASRAYRRPLAAGERTGLTELYDALLKKGQSHEEAFRSLLARVLISPSFLLHIEEAPPGEKPGEVNDWELASRLSFFLWSSIPDDELRTLAAAGKLGDLRVLAAQTKRMMQDERVRAMAIEFGTQWIHVRGFDQLNEKSEALFPTFNADLRSAMNEESVLFFKDMFQQNRSVKQILAADYTYLNETLAKHYKVPGVTGPQWRRVESVRKYGRGGILGFASVQAKQAGASRTSPVLRGNWVYETLLGQKLPRPPANVPQLPEKETGNNGKSMRQLVEMHVRAPECANCHKRIDPFGFALEHYDPIGRLRDKDLGGLPIDSNVQLANDVAFKGIDGLREYLLTKKSDVFLRVFCRRLLGYALRRSVTLSDQVLIDAMVDKVKTSDARVSDLVLAIVTSPQFRMIRGGDYPEDN